MAKIKHVARNKQEVQVRWDEFQIMNKGQKQVFMSENMRTLGKKWKAVLKMEKTVKKDKSRRAGEIGIEAFER